MRYSCCVSIRLAFLLSVLVRSFVTSICVRGIPARLSFLMVGLRDLWNVAGVYFENQNKRQICFVYNGL